MRGNLIDGFISIDGEEQHFSRGGRALANYTYTIKLNSHTNFIDFKREKRET